MRTASAKRRGRPRKEGVERHPCGKVKQPTPEDLARANRSAVVAQRMKHHGLAEKAANDDASGSVVGRLYLMGAVNGLSQDQYLAARRIAEAHHDAGIAILRPQMHSGSDFGGVRGYDAGDGSDAAYAALVARRTKRWRDMRSAILGAGSFAMMAVQAVVIEDKEPKSMMGDLRLALNAVHRLHSVGGA